MNTRPRCSMEKFQMRFQPFLLRKKPAPSSGASFHSGRVYSMSISFAHESTGFKWPRMRICGIALLALLLGLTAGIQDAFALPSNNVPLDNWSYAALDKLAGFGLIHSDVHGMRPYSRLEVARLVNEALNSRDENKLEIPPLIEHLLKRFQREFKEELTVYGRGREEAPAALVVKPIEEARARYVYSEG